MTSLLNRVGTVAVAAVVVSGLAIGSTLTPTRTPTTHPVEVKVGVNAVCPVVESGQGDVFTAVGAITEGVTMQPLSGGAKRELSNPSMIEITKPTGPLRLTVPPGGHGAGVALTQEKQGLAAGLAATRCEDPATSTWFVGVPSSATRLTDLVLSNSDETPAEVDLTFYGAGGRLLVASGHSIVVRPDQSVTVALEPMFTDSQPVTVLVRSPQGRVSAFARVRGLAAAGTSISTGADWHGQSVTPRKDLVLPGVPGGAGARQLVITNPGKKRAVVQVEIMGVDGSRTLEGAENLPVRAESSAVLDVSRSLGEGVVALRLHSDQDVTASLLADAGVQAPDFATAVAAPVFSGAALLPVSLHGQGARMSLANTSDVAGSVKVTFFDGAGRDLGQATSVQLAPHSSGVVPVPSQGLVSARLETVGDIKIAAAMVLSGPTGPLAGLAIVPFHASSSSSQESDPVNDARVGR